MRHGLQRGQQLAAHQRAELHCGGRLALGLQHDQGCAAVEGGVHEGDGLVGAGDGIKLARGGQVARQTGLQPARPGIDPQQIKTHGIVAGPLVEHQRGQVVEGDLCLEGVGGRKLLPGLQQATEGLGRQAREVLRLVQRRQFAEPCRHGPALAIGGHVVRGAVGRHYTIIRGQGGLGCTQGVDHLTHLVGPLGEELGVGGAHGDEVGDVLAVACQMEELSPVGIGTGGGGHLHHELPGIGTAVLHEVEILAPDGTEDLRGLFALRIGILAVVELDGAGGDGVRLGRHAVVVAPLEGVHRHALGDQRIAALGALGHGLGEGLEGVVVLERVLAPLHQTLPGRRVAGLGEEPLEGVDAVADAHRPAPQQVARDVLGVEVHGTAQDMLGDDLLDQAAVAQLGDVSQRHPADIGAVARGLEELAGRPQILGLARLFGQRRPDQRPRLEGVGVGLQHGCGIRLVPDLAADALGAERAKLVDAIPVIAHQRGEERRQLGGVVARRLPLQEDVGGADDGLEEGPQVVDAVAGQAERLELRQLLAQLLALGGGVDGVELAYAPEDRCRQEHLVARAVVDGLRHAPFAAAGDHVQKDRIVVEGIACQHLEDRRLQTGDVLVDHGGSVDEDAVPLGGAGVLG